MIYTRDNFEYRSDFIGALVSQEVVDDAVNALPPACMRSDCTQLGEPYSHRVDPATGRLRPTFATFRRVGDGVWEFCGYCFRGENTPRGNDPAYCSL